MASLATAEADLPVRDAYVSSLWALVLLKRSDDIVSLFSFFDYLFRTEACHPVTRRADHTHRKSSSQSISIARRTTMTEQVWADDGLWLVYGAVLCGKRLAVW
jgi:hypothetical protein